MDWPLRFLRSPLAAAWAPFASAIEAYLAALAVQSADIVGMIALLRAVVAAFLMFARTRVRLGCLLLFPSQA